MASRLLARRRVKRDHLHAIAVRSRAREPAHRSGTGACEVGIAVGLDLDLHRQLAGNAVQQLTQQHRGFHCRAAVAIKQVRRAQLTPGCLMSPALGRRAAAEPGIVQEDELPVGGQTDVRLQSIDRSSESGVQRLARGVRSRVAAETVCKQQRQQRHGRIVCLSHNADVACPLLISYPYVNLAMAFTHGQRVKHAQACGRRRTRRSTSQVTGRPPPRRDCGDADRRP